MTQYLLYYWDVPFRGIFPQLFLEEIGADYEWHDASEIYPEKSLKIHNPGMAPPYLFDVKNEIYLAQMPAIMMHLAREYDYLPKRSETMDLALKIILDCNDVLMEITNCFGLKMWEKNEWKAFRTERLARWMELFEQTGLSHGFKTDKGFLLGTRISVADIVITALFGTLIHSFPKLEVDLKKHAPHIHSLCMRIEQRPAIQDFLQNQRSKFGQTYCGGDIEKSLREMISFKRE